MIAAQKGMVEERLKLCKALWDADIKVSRFALKSRHSEDVPYIKFYLTAFTIYLNH